MEPRSEIRFLLNDREMTEADVAASDTLLDYLRLQQRLTGTKEGCAEGDCGACTVLIGRLQEGRLRYEPVNACIRFLASVDGCHVVTIEHLRGPEGALHPVQQAMVEEHGAQCGFCTPGIVMSLYALWMETPEPTEDEVETALQGNLCRCTGYAPIIRAATSVSRYGAPTADFLNAAREDIRARLAALADGRRVETGPEGNRAILPADLDDLAALLEEQPGLTIVAGATDVGLWVTKFLRQIGPAVFLSHLDALREIEVRDNEVIIGAGVTYEEFRAVLAAEFAYLESYWNRIAGWQVRSVGTIGGNVANGSPIGDTPPVLISLGASVELRKGAATRTVPLEDFFIAYGKQDRAPGEFVSRIRIPKPAADTRHAAYKISKRRDEDISSVAAGFAVTVTGNRITGAVLAYGGMAGTPMRARNAEAALIGQPFTEAAFAAAADALAKDFTPLSDWRASAEYRLLSAGNLLRRFCLEAGPDATGPVRLERA